MLTANGPIPSDCMWLLSPAGLHSYFHNIPVETQSAMRKITFCRARNEVNFNRPFAVLCALLKDVPHEHLRIWLRRINEQRLRFCGKQAGDAKRRCKIKIIKLILFGRCDTALQASRKPWELAKQFDWINTIHNYFFHVLTTTLETNAILWICFYECK